MEEAIQQCEEELKKATLENDEEATRRLLAEDWLNINPNGTVTDKTQLLNIIHSFAFKSIADEEVRIRLYGDTAIVTGVSTRILAGPDATEITRRVRFTRVWVRREAHWQVVSAQSTPLPEN